MQKAALVMGRFFLHVIEKEELAHCRRDDGGERLRAGEISCIAKIRQLPRQKAKKGLSMILTIKQVLTR